MRRSARVLKKPDVYVPTANVKRVEYHDTDDESESDQGSEVSEEEEIIEPRGVKTSQGKRKETSSSRSSQPSKRARRTPIVKAPRRVHLVDIEESLEDDLQDESRLQLKRKPRRAQATNNVFFDAVQAGSDVTEIVTVFRDRYESSRTASQTELMNFILIAAGAQKGWIRKDVNLEELEPGEVYEELTDLIQALKEMPVGSIIPLSSTGKQKTQRLFKEKFVAFWETFVTILLPFEKSSASNIEILKSVIRILICFSSLPLANIRFAVALSLFTMIRKVQQVIVILRGKSDLTSRQHDAQGKISKKSAKFKTFDKMKEEYDALLHSLNETSEEVYTTIFVNRYKDCHEDVRELCASHLGSWIGIDPLALFSDEYIKYLGWMCSDRVAAVRRAVIVSLTALLDLESHVLKLSNFVERFADRFVEMAVGDADEDVAVRTMSLLRRLQRASLLDSLSEEALDLVDEVVFDAGASLVHRREALAFVFDHTEGFDPRDVGETELEQRRLVTVQLETVVEFLEHHLGPDPDSDAVAMLVEACSELPQSRLLRNWSTMTSMLFVDSSSQRLSSAHTRILIKLFVASAVFLQTDTDRKERRLAQTHEEEQLTECLLHDLPRLLQRFRDEESNLASLICLLSCYDTSAVNQKHFKPLMKVACEIYESSSNTQILSGTVAALREIVLKASHLRATVETSIKDMLRRMRSKLQDSSFKNDSQLGGSDKDGAIFEVGATLHRLAFLWQQIDCRQFLSTSLEDFADGLVDISEGVFARCKEATSSLHLYGDSCKDVAKCLYSLVLWSSRDIFMYAKSVFADGKGDASGDDAMESSIHVLHAVREKLLNLLLSWLKLQGELPSSEITRQLHFEAFRIVGDMRVLFTNRMGAHRVVDDMAWSPPKDLLESMRRTFESEGSDLASKLRSLGESADDEDAANKFATDLMNGLIVPMGVSIIYDIERLNRRQAASVLGHLVDQNERVQSFVKTWAKKLKDYDPLKYLEVQLLALKVVYSESILSELQKDDDFDHFAKIKEGYKAFEALSSKLAQSLGVGKFKGEMVSALREFMKMGIEFAFKDINNLGFFRGLMSYIRFLSSGEMKFLATLLADKVDQNESWTAEIKDERNASSEVQALIEFRDAIGGKKKVTRRRPTSLDSSVESRASKSAEHMDTSLTSTRRGGRLPMTTVPEEVEASDEESSASDEAYTRSQRLTEKTLEAQKSLSNYLRAEELSQSPFLPTSPLSHRNIDNSSNMVCKRYSSRSPSSQHSTPASQRRSFNASQRGAATYVLGLHLEDVSPIPEEEEQACPPSQDEEDIDAMFAQVKRLPRRGQRI